MIATIIGLVIGIPVAILMILRLITAVTARAGRLAGDDRFHEMSKKRTSTNAHITVYWFFGADGQRFSDMAAEARDRFKTFVKEQTYFPLNVPATTPAFAVIAKVKLDTAIADMQTAILKTTSGRLDLQLPVQLLTFPKEGALALTLDHTMVSGLTFARCMAFTLGDPENKGSRAFPTAWYFPIVSELALLWYIGRVVAAFTGWKALPVLPENAGVSPETVYYDFNVQALKLDAIAECPDAPPSTLALIAAHTVRGLLRSMRGNIDRPLRVGFSVAFTHSKILHNNVGLIVIDVPVEGADMTLPELAKIVTKLVGKRKMQAWHSNNFLKTIPRVPATSYRSGVDVIFTTYPSPPADLFKAEDLTGVRVEVREITYPIYVNAISYLERSFVSLVVNTPAVDLDILRAEHADKAVTVADADHALTPEESDDYRELLNI